MPAQTSPPEPQPERSEQSRESEQPGLGEFEPAETGPAGRPAQATRPSRDVFRVRPPARRDRQLDVLAAIALGGGLGSVARYLLSTALPVRPGQFPWATFLTNLSGGFVLGLLMVFVVEIWPPRRYVRPFVGVGVLGGFTTFSTFAVEIRGLVAHGARTLADAYALDSLVGGLATVWCGIALGRLIGRRPVRRMREGRDT